MDRNSIIGLSLIFLIIIGYAYMSQPSEAELKAMKQQQDSLALMARQQDSLAKQQIIQQQQEKALLAVDTVAAGSRYGIFAPFIKGENQHFTLENKELRIVLAAKGGHIESVELKNYKRHDQKTPLLLLENNGNQLAYTLQTNDGKKISTQELYFSCTTPHVTVAEGGEGKLVLSLKINEQQSLEQIYSLKADGFSLDYQLKMNGISSLLNKSITLNWRNNTPQQEQNRDTEKRMSTVYYRLAGTDKTEYLKETADDEKKAEGPVQWISFKQQFFNATLISPKALQNVAMESRADASGRYIKKYAASAELETADQINFQFYFGPNHFKTLQKLEIGLEKIIPLGWMIFRWVNQYVVINLFHWLGQISNSYGLIILLMTLIIKLLLFPLVYRSYLSTVKMRLLKPEMDEIKEKYGDDLQKTQMENMKLFRQAGVSPMGGCVPILLQMPILIAMFAFFPSAFELRQQSFLWAHDLSTYDSIWTFGDVPIINSIYGDHVSLFTLLMTISTLIYTRMNNQLSGATGQMKWIGYMMPIIFLGVFNNYAAGLSYYYFLSNLITFAQQWGIRQFVNEKALHAQIQENKKKPPQKSKFQQKLEDMAKLQQPQKPIKKK